MGLQELITRFTASPAGVWTLLRVLPPIDRALLRLTRGRVSSAAGRVCLVVTTGARSGKRRASPLFFLRDGDRIVLIGSKGGSPRHPGWYHNLRAHPETAVLLGGEERSYRAHEAEGPERDRLWACALASYAGYAAYQQRAGARRIPIMVLVPVEAQ
jgi:deazaflavin-dependent oxidoreductase (nitroreductase family)